MGNKILLAIMYILFNPFGVPDFMRSKKLVGLLKIALGFLTFGVAWTIFSVIGLIQGIIILLMKKEDFDKKYCGGGDGSELQAVAATQTTKAAEPRKVSEIEARLTAEVEAKAREYAAAHSKEKKKIMASVKRKAPFFAWVVRVFALGMAAVTFTSWIACTVFAKINANISADQTSLQTIEVALKNQEKTLTESRQNFLYRYNALSIEEYCSDIMADDQITDKYDGFVNKLMNEVYGEAIDKNTYNSAKLKNFLEANAYGTDMLYADFVAEIIKKDFGDVAPTKEQYDASKLIAFLNEYELSYEASYSEMVSTIFEQFAGFEFDEEKYELFQLKNFMDTKDLGYRTKYLAVGERLMRSAFGEKLNEKKFNKKLSAATNVDNETKVLKDFLDSDIGGNKSYGYQYTYARLLARVLQVAYGERITQTAYDERIEKIKAGTFLDASAKQLKAFLDSNELGYDLTFDVFKTSVFEKEFAKVAGDIKAPNEKEYDESIEKIIANDDFTNGVKKAKLTLETATYEGVAQNLFWEELGREITEEEFKAEMKDIRKGKVSDEYASKVSDYLKNPPMSENPYDVKVGYDKLVKDGVDHFYGEELTKEAYDELIKNIKSDASLVTLADKVKAYVKNNGFDSLASYDKFKGAVLTKVYGEAIEEATYAPAAATLTTNSAAAAKLKAFVEEKGYSNLLSFEGFKAKLSEDKFGRPVNGKEAFEAAVNLFSANERITKEALEFKSELARLTALSENDEFEAKFKEDVKIEKGYTSKRLSKAQSDELQKAWKKFQELLVYDFNAEGLDEIFMELKAAVASPVDEQYAYATKKQVAEYIAKYADHTQEQIATYIAQIKQYNTLMKPFAEQTKDLKDIHADSKLLSNNNISIDTNALVSVSESVDLILEKYGKQDPEDLAVLSAVLDTIDVKLGELSVANSKGEAYAQAQEALQGKQSAMQIVHRILLWLWVLLEAIAILAASMLMTLSEDLGGKKAVNLVFGLLLFFALAIILVLALHLAIV